MRAGAVDGVSLLRNDLIVPRTPPQKFRPEETCTWIDRMKELECGVIRKEGAQHLPSIVAARDEEVATKIYGGQCEWIDASGRDAGESKSSCRALLRFGCDSLVYDHARLSLWALTPAFVTSYASNTPLNND